MLANSTACPAGATPAPLPLPAVPAVLPLQYFRLYPPWSKSDVLRYYIMKHIGGAWRTMLARCMGWTLLQLGAC